MCRQVIRTLIPLMLLLLAASSARAQEETRYPPGYDPNAPSPEAADQTRGMALMSASVASDGALQASGGVVSSARVSTGFYSVKFDRSVENCTCTASFGSHSGTAVAYLAQNYISANCPFGDPDNVTVWIIRGGVDGDYPFQLIVFCPK